MMSHEEIKKNKYPKKQERMLLAIADFNEGWIDEDSLESKLYKILKTTQQNK